MRGLLFLCLIGTALGELQYNWGGEEENTPSPSVETCSDPSTCGCCLMKKQVEQSKMYFDRAMNKLNDKMNQLHAALSNLRSSRTAFSVALTDTKNCFGSDHEVTLVVYEKVFLNLGAAYDNGVFTVQRAGVYSLALTVYSDSGAQNSQLRACAELWVDNEIVAVLRDHNKDDQEDSATVVMTHQLATGSRVFVKVPANCELCDNGNHYNTFSGFLLYPTN